MLRRMPWRRFVEWKAFDEIEPIGGVRMDYNTANIVATMINLRRREGVEPLTLEGAVVKWGRTKKKEAAKPPQKTWQQLKFMGQWLAALYNQAEDSEKAKRAKRKRKT